MKTKLQHCLLLVTVISLAIFAGCEFLGGAAAGAAGTGAAYEYSAKRQMDKLEEDYEEGNITKEEYETRKKQIEEGSIIY